MSVKLQLIVTWRDKLPHYIAYAINHSPFWKSPASLTYCYYKFYYVHDGGIKPIAVGCTLRRLVAKTALKLVQETMAAKLAPIQLGFGVKQGTEAAAHVARRFLRD